MVDHPQATLRWTSKECVRINQGGIYYSDRLLAADSSQKELFRQFCKLTSSRNQHALPPGVPHSQLVDQFARLITLWVRLLPSEVVWIDLLWVFQPTAQTAVEPLLPDLEPTTDEEVRKIIYSRPMKTAWTSAERLYWVNHSSYCKID